MNSPHRGFTPLTTAQLVDLLRQSNPNSSLSESRVRHALRSGRVQRPARLGLNLAWNRDDIVALCSALALELPEVLQ